MTRTSPGTEDVRKLHAEVNQIVSQRLTLTTLAITIFAGVVAWIVPKDNTSVGSEVGVFRYGISVLLLLVEFALFLLSYHLTSMLRNVTAYLDVTGGSVWEADWREYRKQFPRYWGYTKPLTLIFLLIGLLAGSLPLLFRFAFQISLQPHCFGVLCLCLTLLYLVFVWGMGVRHWFAQEDTLRARWEKIKADQDQ
jgi:hypothetical protein